MENEMLPKNGEELEKKESIQQDEILEVQETEQQQEGFEDDPAQLTRGKWCTIAGYAFIALGVLDFCLGTFSGIDLTGFRFSPIIFGGIGSSFIKFKDKFNNNREFFGTLALAVFATACVLAFSKYIGDARAKAFVGQWEESEDDGVTRILDLKEDKSFVLTLTDFKDSIQIQGQYKIVDVEGNKKALVWTFGLSTLRGPSSIDIFKEHNERVEQVEKEGQLYGLIDVRVEGDLLKYDGGALKKRNVEGAELPNK